MYMYLVDRIVDTRESDNEYVSELTSESTSETLPNAGVHILLEVDKM